jgi:chromosome segregation ATPase
MSTPDDSRFYRRLEPRNEQLESELAALRRDAATRDAMMSDQATTNAALRAERDQWEKHAGQYMDERDALRAERDAFYMDYRAKCDAETKAQAVTIEALRARVAELEVQVAALSAEPDDEMVYAYMNAADFRTTYEQNARAVWKAMVTAFLRRRSQP